MTKPIYAMCEQQRCIHTVWSASFLFALRLLLRGCWWHHTPWVIFHAGDTQASFQQNLNVLCALIIFLSLGKFWWNLDYPIQMHLYNNYSQILNPLVFLSLRNNQVNMIKIVHRNLSGVSIMADQGRIILQNLCVCNLSVLLIDVIPKISRLLLACITEQAGASLTWSHISRTDFLTTGLILAWSRENMSSGFVTS